MFAFKSFDSPKFTLSDMDSIRIPSDCHWKNNNCATDYISCKWIMDPCSFDEWSFLCNSLQRIRKNRIAVFAWTLQSSVHRLFHLPVILLWFECLQLSSVQLHPVTSIPWKCHPVLGQLTVYWELPGIHRVELNFFFDFKILRNLALKAHLETPCNTLQY